MFYKKKVFTVPNVQSPSVQSCIEVYHLNLYKQYEIIKKNIFI